MGSGLAGFFRDSGRTAIAFSGGVDSTFLLQRAVSLGADVVPYHVSTEFSRRGDLEHAERMCGIIGIRLNVVELSMLDDPAVRSNPADRCYHCKRRIFSAIAERARGDGCTTVADGTNASDDEDGRPGMRALRELGVRSPLREAGLTKDMIREGSRLAGLPTWNMPSNSCLATRVLTGVELDAGLMRRAEGAEDALTALGFGELRVRTDGVTAFPEFRSDPGSARRRAPEVRSAVEPFFNHVAFEDGE